MEILKTNAYAEINEIINDKVTTVRLIITELTNEIRYLFWSTLKFLNLKKLLNSILL